MSTTNLPSINFIKKKTLTLNLKSHFSNQNIKKLYSNNFNHKLFSGKKIIKRASSSRSYIDNMKKIGLTSLIYRNPKTICYNSYINHKIKNINIKRNNNIKINILKTKKFLYSKKIENNPLLKSSSVKFLPIESSVKKLDIGNIDEIDINSYYQKIENSKSYQEYLLKEKEYIPHDSTSISFFKNSIDNNKSNIDNNLNKKYSYSGINNNSTINYYNSLNPLNKKNMIKIKSKFNNQDKFEKYLIERFIKNKKESNNDFNNNIIDKRNIFILLDGSIIINEYNIKGYFISIPSVEELKILNEEKRKVIMNDLLKKCKKIFNIQKRIISLFSPDKDIIIDILDIKDNYKYLYASQNIVCTGVSLVTTPHFLKIYKKGFKNYLEKENINNKLEYTFLQKKYNFKIREKIRGINPKYEIYKPHYSYAEGEDDILHDDFIIYSDDEKRKLSKEKKISKSCNLKNDFFLYLNERNTKKQIHKLRKKLKFDKPFDLRESYQKFSCDFDKIIEKYKKQVQIQLKINPKIYKINPIDSKIRSHNIQFPKDKITKLYLYRDKNYKPFVREQMKYDSFYSCIDKNVTKYYTPFILYNIPKILSEFKNFTRYRLFEIYTKYKDLVCMSYAKNKSDFILESGIDFDTFWKCVEQLSDEKKKYVEKIYNQINRSKLCVLSMQDFLRGMYFIQNTDITEKLDLFLKALDFSGKGVVTYKEAVEICKDAIQRNFSEKSKDSINNAYALKELSQFFASFIFKLIGIDKDKELKFEDLKKAIFQKNNNEVEYLEMFCGANK